jgi:predicted permease
MLILGGNIYIDFQKKGTIYKTEIIKFVLIKNILFPLVVFGFLFLIRPPYMIALILLIQSAVPPVTAVPLMTERMKGNRAVVNQFVVASFIASLVSIPTMVMLFSYFFSP